MFSNYRSYYNKEPEQCCMTDHRIKNNPLSSFENKQRSFSNISYMHGILYIFYNIWGHYNWFISRYPLINGFCQDSWHIGIDREWRECKNRQLWVEIADLLHQKLYIISLCTNYLPLYKLSPFVFYPTLGVFISYNYRWRRYGRGSFRWFFRFWFFNEIRKVGGKETELK